MRKNRQTVARELGGFLKDLGHPDRISIIQLLDTHGPQTVSAIAGQLGLTATRVSQHLSVLRASRVVEEQPKGRERIYRLVSPQLASWLISGLDFVAANLAEVTDEHLETLRRNWVRAFQSGQEQRSDQQDPGVREVA
jgi:DNA-binding transcriptional ArsR family regulator